MRHHRKGRKFGRRAGQRKALMRNLAVALIEKEKIITTEAKAKELRPFVEKMISGGLAGDLAARRSLNSRLPAKIAAKIVNKLAPGSVARKGGYTRIIKLGRRKSDGARLALIELIT